MITHGDDRIRKIVEIQAASGQWWTFNLDYLSNMYQNNYGTYDVQLSPVGHFSLSREDGDKLKEYWINPVPPQSWPNLT